MNQALFTLHQDLQSYYRAGYNNDSVEVRGLWKQIDELEARNG